MTSGEGWQLGSGEVRADMMGSQARVTTTKSSWHHASRKYECWCITKPYASIFESISKVLRTRTGEGHDEAMGARQR